MAQKKSLEKWKSRPYLHGYSEDEQERLYRQARFLESSVYQNVDFSNPSHILEVGCGVGAQTKILIERFPYLSIQGIDAAPVQIEKAKKFLSQEIKKGKVSLDTGDALHLPYRENEFDGAFLCWFLEHVQKPVEVLREIRRVLKASAVIYCTEVLNASFYVHPYSPATLQYWFAFNDYHWSLGGDPFVGAKLANYLMAAGYQNISTEVSVHLYDNRTPKRRVQFIEDWASFLLSGAPGLLKAHKVTPHLVEQMKDELHRLREDPNAVFFNAWVQAKAQAF